MSTYIACRPILNRLIKNLIELFLIIILLFVGIATGQSQNLQVVDSLTLKLKSNLAENVKADIYNQLAYEYISSDSTTTLSHAFDAIELSQKNRYNKGIADAWNHLGTVYWIRGYFEDGEYWLTKERDFTDSLNMRREYARSLVGLGRIMSLKSDLKNSMVMFNEAHEIYAELEDKEGLGHIYVEYGIAHKNAAEYALAIENYHKALIIYEELNKKSAILKLYNNLANVYTRTGDATKGLEHYLKAIAIAQELGDRNSEAVCYSNAGQIYHQQGDIPQAREFYDRALKISREIGNVHETLSLKIKMGNTYLTEQKNERAMQFFIEANTKAKEIGSKIFEAQSNNFIGDAYYQMDQYDKALTYFEGSRIILSEMGYKSDVSHLLIYMADLYKRLGQLRKARQYVLEGVEIANEIDYPITLRDGMDLLAQIESELGNPAAAYKAHVSFKQIYDSLRNDDITKDLTKLRAEFEFQKEKDSITYAQEKANITYEMELDRKETYIQAALSVGTLVFIVLILLYRSYLIKQRKNSELRQKNSEISSLREIEKRMADETIALKERELTTVTMLSHEKNSILQRLEDQIGDLTNKVDERVIPDLKEIKKTIKANLSKESWGMFTYQFEKVHPAFFSKLKEQYPNLTAHDLRLCAYVKVGMDNKEIASVSNITNDGVKKSIYRLKKKMNLEIETDLREFMIRF